MRATTAQLHDGMAALGEALGFRIRREVSDSVLQLRLDAAYRPRVDLMWSLQLDHAKQQARAWALGRDTSAITHLPLVGVEIEGTTPTTKTLASDVANLAALGAPVGDVRGRR